MEIPATSSEPNTQQVYHLQTCWYSSIFIYAVVLSNSANMCSHTMNPALGSNCTSLFVNWWICVGLPWNISTANFPSATSQYSPGWTPPTLPPVNTTIAAPSPTQSGLVSNCQGFYAAQQVYLSLLFIFDHETKVWNRVTIAHPSLPA